MWQFDGQRRPDFARAPGPGQESVWDYPRPPSLVVDPRQVEVRHDGLALASSNACLRLLETASPPTFYLPMAHIDMHKLVPAAGRSLCEWKGLAQYYCLRGQEHAPPVAWGYPRAQQDYARLRDCLSFYPGRITCLLNGQRVRPQAGGFYGGWVTDEICGPWKGEPGSAHW